MSVSRSAPNVFPAVEMFAAANHGMKGIDWDAKLYHGADTYELRAEFLESKLKDDDFIMIVVKVVDEGGRTISNVVRYERKWGELQ